MTGYEGFYSSYINDWYSYEESSNFTKTVYDFKGDVFIDATEYGELLVLSDSEWL